MKKFLMLFLVQVYPPGGASRFWYFCAILNRFCYRTGYWLQPFLKLTELYSSTIVLQI